MSRRDFQDYPFREALGYTLRDFVPGPLRSRWPFKRYFWQADEIARIKVEAERLRRLFGPPDSEETP